MLESARLHAALQKARARLLVERTPDGHWQGVLSSSALSTATAVMALSVYCQARGHEPAHLRDLILHGLDWLAQHRNRDGGWGDTTLSDSNLSTTALVWAVLGAVPGGTELYPGVAQAAEAWVQQNAGSLEPDKLAPAIIKRYGKDRTFSVPILTMCALAGRLGKGPEAWKHVVPLPFELAALPPGLFAALRLPVVSYALPALIAIGQARHHHAPSRNPFARLVRELTRARTLKVLEKIQPPNGGFLEATPLTSFVVMSLAASGGEEHPVTAKGLEFLIHSARTDGSWAIDTNLATWLTTLSINALAESGDGTELPLDDDERDHVRGWLFGQQYRAHHPYTNAAPGGWAWTDLPGGVPDADDTAGALLALKQLWEPSIDATANETYKRRVVLGLEWLMDLQNGDGGIPTFCNGWTNLPFDRSSADITAHTIRAWLAWRPELATDLRFQTRRAIERALHYLVRTQRKDGSWVPLWFGNQKAPDDENPTYGTAKVVLALAFAQARHRELARAPLLRGVEWLLGAQQSDGGWSGSPKGPPSVEETALAVEAIAAAMEQLEDETLKKRCREAVERGAHWLIELIENGKWTQPAPIGFYFARLWYHERLYPIIFTVAALERAAAVLD